MEQAKKASFLETIVGKKELAELVLIIFAVLLFFYHLGLKNLGGDEYSTLQVVKANDYWHLITGNYGLEDYNPPLFFMLCKISVNFFGYSEWAMRFVPALSGIIGVFLFFRLLTSLYSLQVAFVTSLVLMTNPLLIHFGQFGRTYSLLFLCIMMSLYAFNLLLQTQQKKWMLLVAIFNLLAFSSHSFGGFLAGFQMLFLLFVKEKRKYLTSFVAYNALSFSLSLLFLAPFFANLSIYLNTLLGNKIILAAQTSTTPFLPALVYHAIGLIIGMSLDPLYFYVSLPMVLITVFFWLHGAYQGILQTKKESRVWWGLVLGSIVFFVLANSINSATRMKPFYMMPALPLVFLLFANGVSSTLQRGQKFVLPILALLVGCNLAADYFWYSGNLEHVMNRGLLVPYKEITQKILNEGLATDSILVYPDFEVPPLEYYSQDKIRAKKLNYKGEDALPSDLGQRVWFLNQPAFNLEKTKAYEAELLKSYHLVQKWDYLARPSLQAKLKRIVAEAIPAESLALWEKNS